MVDFLVEGEHGEAEDSFAVLAEPQVDFVEVLLLLSCDGFVFAFMEDAAAVFPHLLGSTFDVADVVVVRILLVDNGEGVLIGGVEWHFGVGAVFVLGEGIETAGLLDVLDGLVEFDERCF
jgi:hypothetical protein